MVGSITTLGLGSNMDLQGILDKLRKADEAAIQLKQKEKKSLEERKNEFNLINTKLLAIKSAALNLSLSSSYMKRKSSISDSAVLSANVLDSAKLGKYAITVNRLASKSSHISRGNESDTTVIAHPAGQKSVTGFADTNTAKILGPNKKMTLTYGKGSQSQTITITADGNGMTLDGLITALKNHSANTDGDGNNFIKAEALKGKDGKFHLNLTPAQAGDGQRIEVTQAPASTAFAAPDVPFSYTVGGKKVEINLPAGTTLKKLVELINTDKGNGGVTASLVNTGTGKSAYKLVLKSNKSGENSRIKILQGLDALPMKEQKGSGYTMEADHKLSFSSPVTIRPQNNNTTFVFREDGGKGYGKDITATIPTGVYQNGKELARTVEKAMNDASQNNGGGHEYAVSFNSATGKLEIQQMGNLKKVEIKWDDAASAGAAQALGFKTESRTITPAESSLNSAFQMDGIHYQRDSNSGIKDVVDGVKLSFSKTGSTTLSISNQTNGIAAQVKKMVTTLNDLIQEIDKKDDYNTKTQTWGSLARTPSIRAAKDQLLNLISSRFNPGGSIKGLHDLGFKAARKGNVSLDETVLKKKLDENFGDVQTFFLGKPPARGFADQINDMIKGLTRANGLISSEKKAVSSQISRIEKDIKKKTQFIDKKYTTMAAQFSALDKYLQRMKSKQKFISSMIDAGKKK
ncbi:MAG: flagellar filament capping protein FliD [Desulfobacterales bacterium]|nr:flagellar filament capping protein FliD [Desulfobacterales bacterium]